MTIDGQLATAATLIVLSRFPEAKQLIDDAARQLDDDRIAVFKRPELQVELWMARSYSSIVSENGPAAFETASKAWDLAQKVPDLPPFRRDTCELLLADSARLSGRWSEAAMYYRDVLARMTARYGDTDARVAQEVIGLAATLLHERHFDEARSILTHSLSSLQQALGPKNYMTLNAEDNLAQINFEEKKYPEALKLWRNVRDTDREILGDDSQGYLVIVANVGMVLHELGRNEEAVAEIHDAIEKSHTKFAPSDPVVQNLRYFLVDSLLDLKQTDEAAMQLDSLTEEALNLSDAQPDWEGRLAYQKGRLALLRGDRSEARAALVKAAEIIAAKNPDGPISEAKIRALIPLEN